MVRAEPAGECSRRRPLGSVADPPRASLDKPPSHHLARGPDGQAPGHRRVSRQGQDHLEVPRRRLRRARLGRPRRRPAAQGPRRRRRQRLQAHLRAAPPRQAGGQGAARRPSRTPTELYLATDEDREGEAISLAPARGAQAEGAGEADGVPRDHRVARSSTPSTTRATSTTASSTRPRPGASSTASTATRCRRCSGGRSTAACRRAGCRARRSGWSSSASGSGSRSSPPATGTSTLRSPPRPPFTATLVAVDGARSPAARTSTPAARPRPASSCSTRRGRRRSPTASTGADVHRSLGRGEAVPLVAQAAVHDLDPAAGGRPQAAAVARRR